MCREASCSEEELSEGQRDNLRAAGLEDGPSDAEVMSTGGNDSDIKNIVLCLHLSQIIADSLHKQ